MLIETSVADYEAAGVREDNLLLKIWRHPQATLRYILAYCPNKYIIPLLVLGGITRAIGRLQWKGLGNMSVNTALMLAVVMGGLTGWISYYVYAWGLALTGRWLGGQADSGTFRTVTAWALLPTCLTLLTTALAYSIQGEGYFQDVDLDIATSNGLVVFLLALIELALTAWAVVIFVKGTMLVQQFGVGRAILNMVLPGAVVLAIVFGFFGLYKLLVAVTA